VLTTAPEPEAPAIDLRQMAVRVARRRPTRSAAVDEHGGGHWTERSSYIVLCTLLGVVLGWLPFFLHGPSADKYSILHMNGPVAVWAWYVARMLIGLYVGVAGVPRSWYLRGPLCGFVSMFPLTIVSLATPGCGEP